MFIQYYEQLNPKPSPLIRLLLLVGLNNVAKKKKGVGFLFALETT